MKKILNLIFCLIFSAAASFWATKSLLYSQNSLYNNPHWYTHKQFLVSATHDSLQSLFSRSLFASTAFSKKFFHELIFSKSAYLPQEISFEFKLGQRGYLDIIYNYDEETYQAVRLSRNESFSSAVYKSKPTGEFLSRSPFFYFIEDDKVHSAKLAESNGNVVVYVDNKEIYRTSTQFSRNKIGFFTSLWDLEIKNVKVLDKDSKLHHLAFNYELNFYQFYFKNLVILLGLITSSILIYSFFKKIDRSMASLKFSVLIFASFLLWFIFDFYHYSKIPREFDVRDFSFRNPDHYQFTDFEAIRFNFFKNWYKLFGGKVADIHSYKANGPSQIFSGGIRYCQNSSCDFFSMDSLAPAKKPGTTRIFLVGSSFSANGYGVTNYSDSFFDHLSEVISSKIKKKNFEFYNFSEPGSKVHTIEERLKQNVLNFDADIVIFLYLMDRQDPKAIARMNNFLKSMNKKTIVINPSNDGEDSYSYYPLIDLRRRQFLPLSESKRIFEGEARIIDDLRFSGDIYFMNANDVVRSPDFYNSGNIWWDSVHMTAHGQRLLAKEVGLFIADKIK